MKNENNKLSCSPLTSLGRYQTDSICNFLIYFSDFFIHSNWRHMLSYFIAYRRLERLSLSDYSKSFFCVENRTLTLNVGLKMLAAVMSGDTTTLKTGGCRSLFEIRCFEQWLNSSLKALNNISDFHKTISCELFLDKLSVVVLKYRLYCI